METILLPCLVCLLRNRSVNKYYELQEGEDCAWWNKLMAYIQYVPQYCKKGKNSVYQPHSNNIHQLYVFGQNMKADWVYKLISVYQHFSVHCVGTNTIQGVPGGMCQTSGGCSLC